MANINNTSSNRRVKISAPVKKNSQNLHKHRYRKNDEQKGINIIYYHFDLHQNTQSTE